MRHFSQVNSVQFATFSTIRLEGCTSDTADWDIYSGRKTVTMALCEAMEISYSDLQNYASDRPHKLSPAECRVIDDYISFTALVLSKSDEDTDTWEEAFEANFQYININSGKSVVWFLYLEV